MLAITNTTEKSLAGTYESGSTQHFPRRLHDQRHQISGQMQTKMMISGRLHDDNEHVLWRLRDALHAPNDHAVMEGA